MVETRLLHYFLAVAREQNITGAAKVLHITQPTLSRQMTLLEEELGVKLFVRGSRPLALTEEGLLLRRRAEEILDLVGKTEAELSDHEKQVEGTVSIGCGELASGRMLSDWIAGFCDRYPRVVFDLYTANADQVRRRIDEGLTDIGLLMEPIDLECYEYVRMPVLERWVAVMPAGVPLARREYVTAEELSQIPVIMPSRRGVYEEVASWFGEYYERLKMSAASNLSTNAALLVRAGMGYALTVEGAQPFLDQSEVCMVPLYPELTASSVLAWKRGQPLSTATTRFLDYVRQVLRGEDEEEPSEHHA